MWQADEKLFTVATDFDRSRGSCSRLLFCASNSVGGRAFWLASVRISHPAPEKQGFSRDFAAAGN
jgi:hypothetical protein